ncbi:hypothetical protein MKEN_01112800 [Mycena kentingensis (nom. inval.)]|nr:hypothetical protein MKEN_01112800 [Mycena kentingensis (nom. inval.)]
MSTKHPGFPVEFPPELLTKILGELPYFDLVRAVPLVCKPWKNAFDAAPTLRKKTFRLASEEFVESDVVMKDPLAGFESIDDGDEDDPESDPESQSAAADEEPAELKKMENVGKSQNSRYVDICSMSVDICTYAIRG